MSISITTQELFLCAGLLGIDVLPGFEKSTQDFSKEIDESKISQDLLKTELFEETGSTVRLSAFGQAVLNIIGNADAWLVVQNHTEKSKRYIYVRQADYLCIDERDDRLNMTLLPILPYAIGAYADAINEWQNDGSKAISDELWEAVAPFVTLKGLAGRFPMQIEIVEIEAKRIARFTGEQQETFLVNSTDTVNAVTSWLLSGLKKMERDEDEQV